MDNQWQESLREALRVRLGEAMGTSAKEASAEWGDKVASAIDQALDHIAQYCHR